MFVKHHNLELLCAFPLQPGPLTNTKCPIPKEVPHGTVKVLGQDPGDKMLVTCDEGYWLKGPSTNICQRDGRWSGDTSSCEGKFLLSENPTHI